MEPVLNNGDFVIYIPIKAYNSSLSRETIVIAKHPNISNKLIIKRIKEIKNNGYFLLGENKHSSSDSRHFGLINHKKVIGIAEYRINLNNLKLIPLLYKTKSSI